MQNSYVGDIGDFGKYALLRAVCGFPETADTSPQLRLGVVWYLHLDETNKRDGNYTGYLTETKARHEAFRACAPDIYDSLRRLVVANNRNIIGIQGSGILPENTAYYDRILSYAVGTHRAKRQTVRTNWLNGALQSTEEADVVFVDPDNGISETVDPLRKNGPKFAFMDDLLRFVDRGQSLVIYHHLGRRGTAVQQIKTLATRLQVNLGLPCLPRSLWYHRGTARVYFIAANEHHAHTLDNRMESFLDGPWGDHFDLVE